MLSALVWIPINGCDDRISALRLQTDIVFVVVFLAGPQFLAFKAVSPIYQTVAAAAEIDCYPYGRRSEDVSRRCIEVAVEEDASEEAEAAPQGAIIPGTPDLRDAETRRAQGGGG